MITFKQFITEKYFILNEYFVPDAWPYYIDKLGKIHDVDGDHLGSIANDFDLGEIMPDEIMPEYIDDQDRWHDWMNSWMRKNQVYAIVYDIINKIVYVRCGPKDLNDKQRKSIINFCIKKKSELIYDMHAMA